MSINNVRVPHQKQIVKRLQYGYQWGPNKMSTSSDSSSSTATANDASS